MNTWVGRWYLGVFVCMWGRANDHARIRVFFCHWAVHVTTRNEIIFLYERSSSSRHSVIQMNFFIHDLFFGRHRKNQCIYKFHKINVFRVDCTCIIILYCIKVHGQNNMITIILLYSACVRQNIILIPRRRTRWLYIIIVVHDGYVIIILLFNTVVIEIEVYLKCD